MAFIPTPNTALLELIFLQHEQICEQTIWVEQASPFDLTGLEALATLGAAWWATYMADLLSIDTTLVRIKTTAQDSATAPMYETAVVADNVGTVNSSSQANNVTWTVRFTTALRGRSFRGRNYIVGIPGNAYVDANTIGATFANAAISAYQQLGILIDAASMQHVVVSKWSNNIARSMGLTTPVIGYSYADVNADSQRRRLINRGS